MSVWAWRVGKRAEEEGGLEEEGGGRGEELQCTKANSLVDDERRSREISM